MWSIELIRLTTFPSPDAIVKEPDWWNKLVGEEPETRTSQPKIGGIKEVGQYKDGVLSLEVNPSKLNWTYQPISNDDLPYTSFVDVDNALGTFGELLKNWFDLDDCPETTRLAFGARFIWEVESKEEGYQVLSKLLHAVRVDPQGSSELNYQINRPREIDFNNSKISINRLSKWNIRFVQRFQMDLGKGNHTKFGKEVHYCYLDVDVNTHQSYEGTFSRQEQKMLWNVLVETGIEITVKGDIP